jgi:DNA polymerase elongation subunit (family B)
MQAHQKIQPLLEEAQKTGNLKEVQGKVIKIRDDLEADLRAKLTDDQKLQWKEMLGKPMDPAALFDL